MAGGAFTIRGERAVGVLWVLAGTWGAACAAPPPADVSPVAQARYGRAEPLPPSERSLPEVCFNAQDDNDNGLLDEGCGVEQGSLQFLVAWSQPDVDIDLHVTGPSGDVAVVGARSADGLTKLGDCPGEGRECQDRNQENVLLEGSGAAPGPYTVRIRLEDLGSEEPPVALALGVRMAGRTTNFRVELGQVGSEVELHFEQPALHPLVPPKAASE